MKTAYFDCFSGISGDMILGAMVDAGLPVDMLRRELGKLEIDGYEISASRAIKAGVAATKVTVKTAATAACAHRHFPDIMRLIEKSSLADSVKEKSLAVFREIAEAESEVHGVPVDKVHFHEVGAVDSIVDVVGAATGLVELGIDEVIGSPVNTGSGVVKTDHGTMPVPAPATAFLLRGVPAYSRGPEKELTTPTGAAFLRAMAASFGPMPVMASSVVGHGAGGHDFEGWPNILRVFIGGGRAKIRQERLLELSANIDDMSPQFFSPAVDALFEAGALDVTLAPVHMKKGRPGVILSVLCRPEKSEALERIIFTNTTTLGIRRVEVERVSLPRRMEKVETEYGVIEVKIAEAPDGTPRVMPEYESCREAARRANAPVETVYRAALAAADSR